MNYAIGAVFVVAAGAGVFFMARPHPADEYPLSVADTYQRLSHANLTPGGGEGPFGRLTASVTGNGENTVEWTAHGSMAGFSCALHLNPIAATSTKVAVSCDGGGAGSGAATGMLNTMIRDAVIEMVDATLNGRAYDAEKAKGATAYRWPEDVVHHAGMREAVGDAVKMQADLADEQAKMEQERKADDVAREAATNGQPTIDTAPANPQPDGNTP